MITMQHASGISQGLDVDDDHSVPEQGPVLALKPRVFSSGPDRALVVGETAFCYGLSLSAICYATLERALQTLIT